MSLSSSSQQSTGSTYANSALLGNSDYSTSTSVYDVAPNNSPSSMISSAIVGKNGSDGHHHQMSERTSNMVQSPTRRIGTDGFWIGQILDDSEEEGIVLGGALQMRNFWERKAEHAHKRDEQEYLLKLRTMPRFSRPFSFPKWRSNDALSASLVASLKTDEIIPVDSRLPQSRVQKLMETEQLAESDKFEIHKPFIVNTLRRLRQKSRTFNSRFRLSSDASHSLLTGILPSDENNQWYDPREIHEMVHYESIADVEMTRQKFEEFAWHNN